MLGLLNPDHSEDPPMSRHQVRQHGVYLAGLISEAPYGDSHQVRTGTRLNQA
jgi:hypothetical protein